jgi:hypothetical protein
LTDFYLLHFSDSERRCAYRTDGGKNMSNYNFEGQPDGDWDDRGDLSWEKYDWQQYLVRHEEEVEKFIDLYNRLKDQPEHLDVVAHEMGWDADDWSVGDGSDEDDSFLPGNVAEEDAEDEDDAEDFDPYTLLRHPVFVVMRGLYRYLRRMWSHYLCGEGASVSAKSSWLYAQMLSEGEMHTTLALQSLDMGDYQLAVRQIKIALEDINRTFSVLPLILPAGMPGAQLMEQEIRVRLFDMREVSLRLMGDCADQIDHNGHKE